MTAREILEKAEAVGADCAAIYNALVENGDDEVAEVFAGLDGQPERVEMLRAYDVAQDIEAFAQNEAAFDRRHGL